MRKMFKLPFPDVVIGMENTMPLIIEGINRRTPVEEQDKNESNHSFLRDVHHNFKIWLDNLEGYIEFKNHKVILKRIQVYHQAEDSTDVLKTREELCDEFQQLANELARYIGVKVC